MNTCILKNYEAAHIHIYDTKTQAKIATIEITQGYQEHLANIPLEVNKLLITFSACHPTRSPKVYSIECARSRLTNRVKKELELIDRQTLNRFAWQG